MPESHLMGILLPRGLPLRIWAGDGVRSRDNQHRVEYGESSGLTKKQRELKNRKSSV